MQAGREWPTDIPFFHWRTLVLPLRLLFLTLLFGFSGLSLGAESVLVSVGQAGEAFIVDAFIEAPVSLRTAWEVLVDFDHMAAILSNLTSSKVIARDGTTLIVRQEGVARYGLLSYAFHSEREIRLEPMRRILAKNLSGTARRMESEARLNPAERGHGTQITYRAEIVPDSPLARIFGAPLVRHEIEEQFQLMLVEMKRREASPVATAPPRN
ncbi:MAG TPA: SRPBCC family protein [Azonexus sp.]